MSAFATSNATATVDAAYADLHLHSAFSDGSDAPDRVVERASGLGLAAIALTDHDTTGGLAVARRAASVFGVEFLDGVEIGASFGRTEVHILGLGIKPACGALNEVLEFLRCARSERMDAMLERLRDLGIDIPRSEIEALAGGETLGRLHVARALYAHGIVSTVQRAFARYIGAGRKAYVPKKTISCLKAIETIHEARGLAFLAHPGLNAATFKLAPRLLELPFDGVEVYHTRHMPHHVTRLTQLALERDLLISGGSDCHGTAASDRPDMGKIRLPYQLYKRILDALS